VARSCSYHAQAIRQIRHLLTSELAQTLACSLILSRIDYCNAVLHGAPSFSIKKLQRVQNNAAWIVLEAPRRSHASPLLRTLHWLPVQQRIDYKVALLTSKVRSTSTPSYLRCLTHNLQLAATTLCQPSTTMTFCETCLPMLCSGCLELINSDSVTVLKSRLKTPLLPGLSLFPFSVAHCLAPAPLKLRPYDAIQMGLLLLLLLFLLNVQTVEGSRPRGRPKRTWKEVVREDCQAHKLNKEDSVDRCKWRKVIKEVR